MIAAQCSSGQGPQVLWCLVCLPLQGETKKWGGFIRNTRGWRNARILNLQADQVRKILCRSMQSYHATKSLAFVLLEQSAHE